MLCAVLANIHRSGDVAPFVPDQFLERVREHEPKDLRPAFNQRRKEHGSNR